MEKTNDGGSDSKPNGAKHPFEKAGLGLAPFKYIGLIEQDLCYGQAILNREEYERTGIAITTKPGGTCDYCGTYIVNMFKVRSQVDGKTFKVGSDCIMKVYAEHKSPNMALLANAVKKDQAAIRKVKLSGKAHEARSYYASNVCQAYLASHPHPNASFAAQGKTLRDYFDFVLRACGEATYIKKVAILRQTIDAATE